RLSNTPSNRSNIRFGPELTTQCSAPKAKRTTLPCAPWLSNGSGSSGGAGRPAFLTTKSSIWRVCASRDRHCSSSPLRIRPDHLAMLCDCRERGAHSAVTSVAFQDVFLDLSPSVELLGRQSNLLRCVAISFCPVAI